MGYQSLEACITDLERTNQLIRIKEAVDPNLEMASIHLKVYEAGGPALLFENVIGSKYRCASNIFGTIERSRFLFRDTLEKVENIIALKNDPVKAIKSPFKNIGNAMAAFKALPRKKSSHAFEEISISDIPQIKHWPMDGGAFITLPQVYSEDIDKPGIFNANLGMYRIQLSGNDYLKDKEIGLHYQIHRGIGIHQQKANKAGKPLKVSIFVGGPPSHTLSAVMPLPEGMSEMTFAGLLGGKRFAYSYVDGYCLSNDADFVITGDVFPDDTKPEGPFGDHLGYYSLTHEFPVLKVHKVFAKPNAIWPFTVVGRPPQEDTSFGQLIHEITGTAIPAEVKGLKEVNAVDAAGVHPLLLAVGSERYTPYVKQKQPMELLTIANHVLGKGQLSLAKYVIITAEEGTEKVSTHDIAGFFRFVLKRIKWQRDLHFQTNTTIDTLDYGGSGINQGSKVVMAAYGEPVRALGEVLPGCFSNRDLFKAANCCMPGVIAIQAAAFSNYDTEKNYLQTVSDYLGNYQEQLESFPLLVLCDDAAFLSADLNNFLWVTFTRSNPSHDIYGVDAFMEHKHWGCNGPLIIDARVKPHHAPALVPDEAVEKRVAAIIRNNKALNDLLN